MSRAAQKKKLRALEERISQHSKADHDQAGLDHLSDEEITALYDSLTENVEPMPYLESMSELELSDYYARLLRFDTLKPSQ